MPTYTNSTALKYFQGITIIINPIKFNESIIVYKRKKTSSCQEPQPWIT